MLSPEDLLCLTVGAVVVDVIIIGMNYARVVFVSDELTRWYTQFRVSAMTMDVLIIVLYATAGMRIARRIAGTTKPPTILQDLACIVATQVVGDLLFYVFFDLLPRGTPVFDFFKAYAAEVHVHALWADACMMIGTYAVARTLSTTTKDTQRLSLLIAVYVSQYVLHLK